MMKNTRLSLIDFLRTVALVNMVAFHACYDHFVVYGANSNWDLLPATHVWQQFIVLSFIFVSGMSFQLLSKSSLEQQNKQANWLRPVRQGIKLLLLGEIITLAILYFLPSEEIHYGVLTFMGLAVLLTSTLENHTWQILNKLPSTIGIVLCTLLFILTYQTQYGLASFFTWKIAKWPEWIYAQNYALLGFPSKEFFSTDYVPLLPHIFMYWLGFYTYSFMQAKAPELLASCNWERFNRFGRHTLAIYLVHQPLLLGLLFLLERN